jgi:hypothetical protein
VTITSAMRGALKKDALRKEAFALIKGNALSKET